MLQIHQPRGEDGEVIEVDPVQEIQFQVDKMEKLLQAADPKPSS